MAGRRTRVALVIGSGALKCMATFGVARVLQRERIPVDLVVACSGGAFCGVWLAQGGGDIREVVDRVARGWRDTTAPVSWPAALRTLLTGALGPRRHFALVDDRRLNRSIREFVGDLRFDDLALPLRLVATDYNSGEQVVVATGRLFDAIRATVSIPLVWPPWTIEGRLLVDGAVCDPLPVGVAIREGADVILAVGFEETLEADPRSSLAQVLQLKSMVVNHLYRAQFAFYNLSHHAEVVPIIPRFDRRVGIGDVHLVPWLVEQGERAAEEEMPHLRRLLAADGTVP